MSLHRTKGSLIGLFEALSVNEWFVTEKLGDALKLKSASKPRKLRLRIWQRVYLLCCTYYGFVHGWRRYFLYAFFVTEIVGPHFPPMYNKKAEVSGHIVTVELKSGEIYRGSMVECEDNWNCQLENITFNSKDGKVSQIEHVFIRGSKVRFMVIPDMLKNAPMFKRLESRIKGKSSSLGVGRGRAVAMRARAQAAGRGGAPGRGVDPPIRR